MTTVFIEVSEASYVNKSMSKSEYRARERGEGEDTGFGAGAGARGAATADLGVAVLSPYQQPGSSAGPKGETGRHIVESAQNRRGL